MALLSFYLHQYLGNFIKTEMVQPRYPTVINSFEDLLNLKYHPDYGYVDKKSTQGLDPKSMNIRFIFIRETRTIQYFMDQPKGSVRRAVYDEAVRVYGSHEKILQSFDFKNIEAIMKPIYNGIIHNALIETKDILNCNRAVICAMIESKKESNVNSNLAKATVWHAKNASIPYMQGHVYSEGISPKVRDRLDWYFYKVAESGIVHALEKGVSTGFAPYIKGNMYSCMEDEMSIEIPKIEHLAIKHLASLFTIGSKIFLLAGLVLLVFSIVCESFASSSSSSCTCIEISCLFHTSLE